MNVTDLKCKCHAAPKGAAGFPSRVELEQGQYDMEGEMCMVYL